MCLTSLTPSLTAGLLVPIQYELWLGLQTPTSSGLTSTSGFKSNGRCHVVGVAGANEQVVSQAIALWKGVSVADAQVPSYRSTVCL